MADKPIILRASGFRLTADLLLPAMGIGFIAYEMLQGKNNELPVVLAIFFSPFFVFGLLRLWNNLARCCRLTPQRLDYFNGYWWRGIDRADVKGYRIRSNRNGRWYLLVRHNEDARPCSIPQWLFEHPEAQYWFAGLVDLEPIERAAAQAALENNPDYGRDKPARIQRKNILMIWVILTALGLGTFALMGAMAGWKFAWMLDAFVLVPFAAFALDWAYPHQFRFAYEGGYRDARPSLVGIFLIAGVFVPWTTLDVMTIVDGWLQLQLALVVAVILSAYVLWRAPALRRYWYAVAGVFMVALLYAGFAVAVIDAHGDPAPRKPVPVAAHFTTDRRPMLVVDGTAGGMSGNFLKVTRTTRTAMEHYGVCAITGTGLLGMRWVRYDACPARSVGVKQSA